MMRSVEIGTMVKLKHDGFGAECRKGNTAFVVEEWPVGETRYGYELVCDNGQTISAAREDFSVMCGEALRLPMLTPKHHRKRFLEEIEIENMPFQPIER
jgi:hypothetical protein